MSQDTKIQWCDPIANPINLAENPLSVEDIKVFEELDAVVRKGAGIFVETGKALAAIHAKNLWRAAGYITWLEYLKDAVGISKSQAHRLMDASQLVEKLRKSTLILDGVQSSIRLLSLSEAQVRQLIPLRTTGQENAGWIAAVKKAGGKQPTAKVIQEIVFEILHPGGNEDKRRSRTQQKRELFTRLKQLVDEHDSWDEVRTVLAELAKII